jgi:hypothetical protein
VEQLKKELARYEVVSWDAREEILEALGKVWELPP